MPTTIIEAHNLLDQLKNAGVMSTRKYTSVSFNFKGFIAVLLDYMYTCELSLIMRESRACGSKIVISRIQTNFSRLTDNSECKKSVCSIA